VVHILTIELSGINLPLFAFYCSLICAGFSGKQHLYSYAGWERTAVRSQPAYCTAVYREWQYQRL